MLKVNMAKTLKLLEKAYDEEKSYRVLGKKIGRNEATVHNIIKGKNVSVDLDTLNDIAKYFRVPVLSLMEGDELKALEEIHNFLLESKGIPPDLKIQIEERLLKITQRIFGENNNLG